MATSSSIDARLPERGDVIEFSFLWKHESQAGQVEGAKDRRCVVVSVLSGGRRVVVAPITGTEPAHANKLPLSGGALGLVRNSWIVTSELNVTSSPGHDLRPARSPMGAWWRYGRISDALRTRLADMVETLVKTNQANVTLRT